MRIPALFVALGASALIYVYAGVRYAGRCGDPRPSCLEHRQAGCSIDGVYKIQVGARVIEASCDMDSDGGGWTLVGNYLHRAGARGQATPLIDRLPLQDAESLGADEAGSPSWGHASTALLSALPFREVRFKCRTSAHPRNVDFSVYGPRCLEYFRTGKGACLGTPDLRAELERTVRALPGHDGGLPLSADKGWTNQGDQSLVYYPFFADWKNNWSVANRWQCDDTQAEDRFDTWHQIWVR